MRRLGTFLSAALVFNFHPLPPPSPLARTPAPSVPHPWRFHWEWQTFFLARGFGFPQVYTLSGRDSPLAVRIPIHCGAPKTLRRPSTHSAIAFKASTPSSASGLIPHIALDLSGGNSFSSVLGGISGPLLWVPHTSSGSPLHPRPRSTCRLHAGTGWTCLVRVAALLSEVCSHFHPRSLLTVFVAVATVGSGAFTSSMALLSRRRCAFTRVHTAHGLRGCSCLGSGGCYSLQKPSFTFRLCDSSAFMTLTLLPSLLFFFLCQWSLQGVYRVPASMWPAAFFLSGALRRVYRAFTFSFRPSLYSTSLRNHSIWFNPVTSDSSTTSPFTNLGRPKFLTFTFARRDKANSLHPAVEINSTDIPLSLSVSTPRKGRGLSRFVGPRAPRPGCSFIERSVPQHRSWRRPPAFLPPPFVLVQLLVFVSVPNHPTPDPSLITIFLQSGQGNRRSANALSIIHFCAGAGTTRLVSSQGMSSD